MGGIKQTRESIEGRRVKTERTRRWVMFDHGIRTAVKSYIKGASYWLSSGKCTIL